MNDIKILLNNFPKKRPPIGIRIEKIYREHYKTNRNGGTILSSIARYIDRWMYKKIAESGKQNLNSSLATLEIGAGTLNQLSYEERDSIKVYDIIEPMDYLYKESQYLNLVRNKYKDIREVPKKELFDRIISIATLEHITDLPDVILASSKHLKKDGIFACGIPSEGGFLWGLAWRLSTGLEFRLRYNADYGQLMRHEHVNTADEIEMLAKYFFQDVKIKTFGFGKHFSLYKYIECKNPTKI
jgi:SAM-dependent methyltransferase